MAEIRAAREATQPVRARTGGSTFRNPAGMKAWELIDAAGCRGLTRGGAQVTEKHCNFLHQHRRRHRRRYRRSGRGSPPPRARRRRGVTLEWEIRRIGIPLARRAGDGAA